MAPINDARIAWIVALLGLLGVGAMAFGVATPGQRMGKVEEKLVDHETRIQRLEDMREYLKNIGEAVGAREPQPRKP